jgi:protein-disulfide isomerase
METNNTQPPVEQQNPLPQQPQQSTPVPPPAPNMNAPRPQSNLVPISILVAGLVIAGAIIFGQLHGAAKQAPAAQATAAAPQTIPVDIAKVTTANEPYIGSQSAPVTIAYWSDYQCPYCKQFELSSMPQLITDFVDKGELRIIFKDFPFLGPDSQYAALAARAVWDLYPNSYFAWREAMFNAQDEENSGFGDEPSIIALTKTISGIDATKVSSYIAANQAALGAAITADYNEGVSFGVNGTPSFIAGTKLYQGSLPYADVAALVSAAVKK